MNALTYVRYPSSSCRSTVLLHIKETLEQLYLVSCNINLGVKLLRLYLLAPITMATAMMTIATTTAAAIPYITNRLSPACMWST